jgi:hypothetical protein
MLRMHRVSLGRYDWTLNLLLLVGLTRGVTKIYKHAYCILLLLLRYLL